MTKLNDEKILKDLIEMPVKEDVYPYTTDDFQMYLTQLVDCYDREVSILSSDNTDPSRLSCFKLVLSTVKNIDRVYQELKEMDKTYRFHHES